MIRRLLAIWPPEWALACAGSIYCVFQGIFVYEEMAAGLPLFSLPEEGTILLVIMCGLTIGYAVYRVAAFHPALRPGYYLWLYGTPWTSRKPLPLGPIHLVWQDAVLLGIVFGLSWPRSQWQGVQIIQVFLVAYVLMLGLLHCSMGQKAWGYLALFGLGFTILFVRQVPTFFAVAAVVYGLGFLGLRAVLAGFPWYENTRLLERIEASTQSGYIQVTADRLLGWPYDRLGPPRPDAREIPWDFKWIGGVLMGWWFFVIDFQLFNDGGYLFYYQALLFGVAYRLGIYCNGYLPPINLHARLATGRWITPGYDQVFVAPLAALAVGIAIWYAPDWFAIRAVFLTPFALTLTWWILFAMPPGLKTWRLTGNHRIAPGIMKLARPQ